MSLTEIQIPFKKSRNSKTKKYIGKIQVKSFFTHEKLTKTLEFSEEDEREFLESLNYTIPKKELIIRRS